MPTTRILTAGWETAGHRVRAMLREQCLSLAGSDAFDLSACGVADAVRDGVAGGSVHSPSSAGGSADCVYHLGGVALDARHGAAARRVAFWPAARDMAGQGRPGSRSSSGRGRIVVPSRWSRDRVLEKGVRPERVTVVVPGVDGGVFAPLSRAEREAVRANLGFRDDETVFLHVGDAGEDSGIDLLLKAFARLRSAGSQVRLVLRAEDPDGAVPYDGVIRRAGADDAGLLRPGTLGGIVTVPGPLAAQEWRLLYGAADALVSPDRACAFNAPVIEAIACGCPVIVTRGAAADDICDDDLAWRVSGEVHRDTAGGCFIEPDLDELTDALAELSQGRGFDRLRFAAARMRLMRDLTWHRSTSALAEVLTEVLTGAKPDEATPPPAAVLRGLPQPIGMRFPAQPPRDLAALRRRARTQVTCPGPRDLTVVVQGPCLRIPVEQGAPSIDDALASIRRSFPGAQIVVSTWVGSDIDGLDADDVVLSPDPGPMEHPLHKVNNVNRVLTSTASGLAAATRPFCIKTRNDVLFASDALTRRDLHCAAVDLSLERRIWSPAARLDTSLRPYHPCDMVHYGLTDDLRRLWQSAPFTWDDLYLPEPYGHLERMAAEQAIFVGYLRGLGFDLQLETTFDGRREIVAGSIRHMLGAFDVFDAASVDVVLSPRFRTNPIRPRLYDTHASFEALRSAFTEDPEAACLAAHDAFHKTLGRLLGK